MALTVELNKKYRVAFLLYRLGQAIIGRAQKAGFETAFYHAIGNIFSADRERFHCQGFHAIIIELYEKLFVRPFGGP